MKFYSITEPSKGEVRLVAHQQNGTFSSFLIWRDYWAPIPLMLDLPDGIKMSLHVGEERHWLFDGEASLRIELGHLEPMDSETASSAFPGSELPRFSDEMVEYLVGQPSDWDRAIYIYGLAASSLGWENNRTTQHLEAVASLSSFIGGNSPDGADMGDWQEKLYPLTALTDAWVLNPRMQFTVVDLLNWGFDEPLAVAFGDSLGVLQAARTYEESDTSSCWAVVSTFLLGALSARNEPSVFQALADDLEQTLDLLEAPGDMRSIVAAHWEGQIYPGH